MNDFDRFRVGMIGYGMGKVYAAALSFVNRYYPDLPPVELVGICTQRPASGEQAQRHFGFSFHAQDYHALLENAAINTLVIAPPNYLHFPMLLDSLQTRKAILVDKPLTNNLDEAQQVIAMAHQHERDGQMIFEFRYSPALQKAWQLIQSGRLGEIYSFRATYFRSSYLDPTRSLRWKGSAQKSGYGVLNDLGAHLIDLVTWLVGIPERVAAQTRTFVPVRTLAGGAGVEHIDTDDHFIIQASLPGGALGTIEGGRLVAGAVNDLGVEIYGSQGAVRWGLMDPNFLYWVDARQTAGESGWQKVPTVQQYPDAYLPPADYPGGMLRCIIASVADFLHHTELGRPYDPGLEQGLRVQAVIEAAAQAARERVWVEVGAAL